MSNTSLGRAEKGSKYWMQTVILYDGLRARLNAMIGEPGMEWLSPLAGEYGTFAEYSLGQKNAVSARIGVSDVPGFFDGFWPRRQPQWDGIGIGGDGRILYLVEAKAHVSEMISRLSASDPDSRRLIEHSLRATFETYPGAKDFTVWTDRYYQLANRLAFLRFLNGRSAELKIGEVRLVLLNFVNDHTYLPEAQSIWDAYYAQVWEQMTGVGHAPAGVTEVFFDVGDIH